MSRFIPDAEETRREAIARHAVKVQQAIALDATLIANLSHPIIVFICEAIYEWDGSKDLVIQVPETFWELSESNRTIVIDLFKAKGYTVESVSRKGIKPTPLLTIKKAL